MWGGGKNKGCGEEVNIWAWGGGKYMCGEEVNIWVWGGGKYMGVGRR